MMNVSRLEFEFDVRRSADGVLDSFLEGVFGSAKGGFMDLGVELAVSAQLSPASLTHDDRLVCRVIGDHDAVVAAFHASRCESDVNLVHSST